MFNLENNLYIASITHNQAEISEAIGLRFHLYQHRPIAETINTIPNKKQHSRNVQAKKKRVSFADGYDKFSTHIIVTEKSSNSIVAGLRLMDSYAAFNLGGFFSETEFDLGNLQNSAYLAEISQLVIHPNHRNKDVFKLVWEAIRNYCLDNRIDRTILNLTLPMASDDASDFPKDAQNMQQLIGQITPQNFDTARFKVRPYQTLPSAGIVQLRSQFPITLQYCLDNGGKLCGDAFWNKDLNTADVLLQLYILDKEENQNFGEQYGKHVA